MSISVPRIIRIRGGICSNSSLKENAKYSVILVLKTVIYKSKLLGFQNIESLVFDAFLSKTIKKSE